MPRSRSRAPDPEVGGALLPWERRQGSQWHVEGLDACTSDPDGGLGGDGRRRSGEVRAEAWEPLDHLLAGREPHVRVRSSIDAI